MRTGLGDSGENSLKEIMAEWGFDSNPEEETQVLRVICPDVEGNTEDSTFRELIK